MPRNINMLLEGDDEYDEEVDGNYDQSEGDELCYFDEYGEEVNSEEAMYGVELDT